MAIQEFDFGFPFQMDRRGRLYNPSHPDHVRQLMELVLFTSPGERVNRPEFGCGLLQALFAPTSGVAEEAAAEFLVETALQRWLPELVSVSQVRLEVDDSLLKLTIEYSLRQSPEERRVTVFELPRSM